MYVWFASLLKSGQHVVKAVRISSPKYLFLSVARWFDFTNFITENKHSQKYGVLNTEMSHTLVF